MKKNKIIPDSINQPKKEPKTKTCYECNGAGETVEWDEDDAPFPVTCYVCGGLGELELEDEDL